MNFQIFEEIIKLLRSWGIEQEDWIVTGKHARNFAGYKVQLRKNHINIFVDAAKLPWKPSFLDFAESIPQRKTKYFKQYMNFFTEQNYDLDITPCSADLFEQLKKDRIKKTINTFHIYYCSILSNLKIVDIKLSNCDENRLGIYKGLRLLDAIEDLKNLAELKKEQIVIDECTRIIDKYSGMKPLESNKELHGVSLGEGSITGKAIIFKEGNSRKIFDPMILVTDEFSVKQIVHFNKLIGVITESGGFTSHISFVSQEFDVPVIMNVKNATKLIKEGQYVTINFDKGEVELNHN